MKYYLGCNVILFCFLSCTTPKTEEASSDGFVTIFNGETLDGWEGDPVYWRVEEGILVGEITPETLLKRNSFIIWRGGVTKDFELKTEYRVTEEGNSGINYRSEEIEGLSYALAGYQCDIDGANNYTGMNYEERKRTTLAKPGKVVVLDPVSNGKPNLKDNIKDNQWLPAKETGVTGDIENFKSQIKPNVWNEVHLVVKGNRMQHYVNGNLMSDVTDNDQINRKFEGLLGVQVHVGPPMKIEYRNIRIKHLYENN